MNQPTSAMCVLQSLHSLPEQSEHMFLRYDRHGCHELAKVATSTQTKHQTDAPVILERSVQPYNVRVPELVIHVHLLRRIADIEVQGAYVRLLVRLSQKQCCTLRTPAMYFKRLSRSGGFKKTRFLTQLLALDVASGAEYNIFDTRNYTCCNEDSKPRFLEVELALAFWLIAYP